MNRLVQTFFREVQMLPSYLVLLCFTLTLVSADPRAPVRGSGEKPKPVVAVLRGEALARQNPARRGEVDALTGLIAEWLSAAGIPYRRLEDTPLSSEVLREYKIAILPYNQLDEAATKVLEEFVAGGGKLLACSTRAPARFYRLLGLVRGELQEEAARAKYRLSPSPRDFGPGLGRPSLHRSSPALVFTPQARRQFPGLPEEVPNNSTHACAVTPLADTQILAYWTDGQKWTRPGVTLNRAGLFLTQVLRRVGRVEKVRFLRSVVARFAPEVWPWALRRVTDAVGAEAGKVKAEWMQRQVAWHEPRRSEMARRVAQATEPTWPSRPEDWPAPTTNPHFYAGAVERGEAKVEELRRLRYSLHPTREGEVRGVWIHTYRPLDWEAIMRNLAAHGFNSIFVRVGRGGNVIYNSDLLPKDPWAQEAGVDELQRALTAAHRHGLDLHAWKVNFHLGSARRYFPEHYRKFWAETDRLVRDSRGRQAYWANPGDPRNAELEFRAMLEIVEKYEVDGLHLDYIRYPDDPSYDFDYGPVSRRVFEQTYGITVPNWPADVIYGPLKLRYENWERENINRLVRRVYTEVKRRKPQVQVSAAVWRHHRRYWGYIKQDWPKWVREGWLDFVVPMDYTANNDSLRQSVEEQRGAIGGRVPLVVGLGSWLLNSPEQLREQVEIVRQVGADGFVLFSYNAEQIQEQLAALAAGLTARPTYPAYEAPAVTFALHRVGERKDAPYFARVGKAVTVTCTVRLQSPLPQKLTRVEARLTLETPGERELQELARFEASQERTVRARFAVPEGLCRPVLRGTMHLAGGERRPFVRRGPVLEGMSAALVRELWRRESPPRVRGPGRRVAVYAGGLGAANVFEALAKYRPANETELNVFYLHRLRPHHLRVAEVLILPQLFDVSELWEQVIARLRTWVEQGGRLILLHDAVGFRIHPTLFPEVGRGRERRRSRELKVVHPLPGLAVGQTLEHAFSDHIALLPAEGATVLLTDTGTPPRPVVVAKRVGRGMVILNGTLPGYGVPLTPEEERLLMGLIIWSQAL